MKEENSIARKIGIRIKELRQKRGISQEKLSELSGIEHKHIQLLESNNPSNARIDSIQSIAEAFDLSIQEFFSHDLFRREEPPLFPVKKTKVILKVASPETGRKILFQDEYNFAVYGFPGITRGHCNIIPKKGTKNYFQLLPEERYSLWDLVEKTVKYIRAEFKPDGFNIGMDLGEMAGQREEYLILDIIPRYKGDSRNPSSTGMRRVLPDF